MMTVAADPAPAGTSRFEAMRHAMVASQLRPNGVNDPRVVEAMAVTPREAYLPAEQRSVAYRDTLIPLAGGRRQNMPLSTGLLLTEAKLVPQDRVLLIGAAGGYAAALLAQLVASVVAVEDDAGLFAIASSALADEPRITLVNAPLQSGWAEGAPYDVLVIDGAIEHVPEALVAQLRPDGRAVAGVLDRGVTRLAAGRRTQGGFGMVDFADAECAVLPGFGRPQTFQFRK
jgi:protein-L-isoaspartate(D-aspartate) O-methyltransferase